MKPQLPPPDPHEPFCSPSDPTPLGAPTVVLGAGSTYPESDRLADLVLDLRPGLLFVFG